MTVTSSNSLDLSIIVPIYNTPSVLLERCISSILENISIIDNVEVLLIDDGSTKPYIREIMDRSSQKDNRIIPFYKNNSGVSDTRNKGIELAKGEFVTFVDAEPGVVAPLLFNVTV